VEPHVAGLSGLRPEVSEEHGAVDMLCTVAREVTYVRGSIPADSLDCRRHVCCYLLAYREWRPQRMEGSLNPLKAILTKLKEVLEWMCPMGVPQRAVLVPAEDAQVMVPIKGEGK
jgi:hypothetical protein